MKQVSRIVAMESAHDPNLYYSRHHGRESRQTDRISQTASVSQVTRVSPASEFLKKELIHDWRNFKH